MGLPPAENFDRDLSRATPEPFVPPIPPGYMQQREPLLRYVVLFILTLGSTTVIGISHWASYAVGFTSNSLEGSWYQLLAKGLWYSLSILAILGAHEFGHYFACRYYRVDASLPYFIPAPIALTGTLGAVIRIRQQIWSKRALFDIGIAGPIAGFVVAIPVLFVGMYLSKVIPVPVDYPGEVIEMGEPLLFQFAAWMTFGPIPDGFTVNMHPMAFAAWFGMLATVLNLFPVGQLDGGHIAYSVFGRRSAVISIITVLVLLALAITVSLSWGVWTLLVGAMLVLLGPHHPKVMDEDVPLDATRRWLALFAVVMFVLCFTPAPIEMPLRELLDQLFPG